MRRDVDARHNVLAEHAPQGLAHLDFLGFLDWNKTGKNGLPRLVHAQRIRVVAVQAADGLRDAHSRLSSSRVLMLRKASASSSKLTSTTLSAAYQASIFLPPAARKASRLSLTCLFMRANTGCD